MAFFLYVWQKDLSAVIFAIFLFQPNLYPLSSRTCLGKGKLLVGKTRRKQQVFALKYATKHELNLGFRVFHVENK